jgi:hypothetical protein
VWLGSLGWVASPEKRKKHHKTIKKASKLTIASTLLTQRIACPLQLKSDEGTYTNKKIKQFMPDTSSYPTNDAIFIIRDCSRKKDSPQSPTTAPTRIIIPCPLQPLTNLRPFRVGYHQDFTLNRIPILSSLVLSPT